MRVWDAEASRATGAAALGLIDRRAFMRGVGVDDAPLAPYSSGYAAQLRANGESTRVDLNRSGRLRAAVADALLEATEAGAVLGIRGPESTIAGIVNAARPFWGISPTDRIAIGEATRAAIVAAMDRR